jgi:hypothetical protein
MPQPTAKSTRNIGHDKTTRMDFFDALKKVNEGQIVTRELWDDPMVHFKMHKGQLVVRLDDGLNHPLIVSQEDLDADDYFVTVMGPQVQIAPIVPAATAPKADPPAAPPGELDCRDKSAPDA